MKYTRILTLILITGTFAFAGCKDNKLKEDVKPIADAMCRFIDVQNRLKQAIDSNDTAAMQKLTMEQQKMQIEMTVLNEEFKAKYGDKVKDQEFGKKFGKEMKEALLECPHLSKEDRDAMMKTE